MVIGEFPGWFRICLQKSVRPVFSKIVIKVGYNFFPFFVIRVMRTSSHTVFLAFSRCSRVSHCIILITINIFQDFQRQRGYVLKGNVWTICWNKNGKNSSFSDPKLMTPAIENIVDHKHNLTLCLISKSGSTMLKTVLLQDNGYDVHIRSHAQSLVIVHSVQLQKRFGLTEMRYLNSTVRNELVQKYRHILSIHNPFDRLLSAYNDKVVDQDASSNRRPWQEAALRFSRP